MLKKHCKFYRKLVQDVQSFPPLTTIRLQRSLSNGIISEITRIVKTKNIDFLKTNVETSKKLDFFKQFKQSFSPEPFLDSLINFIIKRD